MHTAPPCPSSILRAFALGFGALVVLLLVRAERGGPSVPHVAARGDSGVVRRSGFSALLDPARSMVMAPALLGRLAGSTLVAVRLSASRRVGGRLVRAMRAGGGRFGADRSWAAGRSARTAARRVFPARGEVV
ncbi:MAG: hypothetical protein ACTS3F_13695 [Phycisphaerales bacterium]